MVNVSILLLALALVAVAASVFILGKRVTALEKEFGCRPSIKTLKAANRIQSFLENRSPSFIAGDGVNPFDKVSADLYSEVRFSDIFPKSDCHD